MRKVPYKFRDARIQSGKSQKEVAEQLGISNATVNNWEPGEGYQLLRHWKNWRTYIKYQPITFWEEIKEIKSIGAYQSMLKIYHFNFCMTVLFMCKT